MICIYYVLYTYKDEGAIEKQTEISTHKNMTSSKYIYMCAHKKKENIVIRDL